MTHASNRLRSLPFAMFTDLPSGDPGPGVSLVDADGVTAIPAPRTLPGVALLGEPSSPRSALLRRLSCVFPRLASAPSITSNLESSARICSPRERTLSVSCSRRAAAPMATAAEQVPAAAKAGAHGPERGQMAQRHETQQTSGRAVHGRRRRLLRSY